MKRLALYLARLYPRRWRERYGRELEALLEDTQLTWRDLVDLARSSLEVRMTMEPAAHILQLASRDIPHGSELESAVEVPRQDGSTMVVRSFYRELDFGDSYVTMNHWSRGTEPAQTVLVFGRKGEIDGDFRTDETEMVVLRADGTVRRTEQTVKTWLKYDAIRDRLRARYRTGMAAGLSPDEIHSQIAAEPEIQTVLGFREDPAEAFGLPGQAE